VTSYLGEVTVKATQVAVHRKRIHECSTCWPISKKSYAHNAASKGSPWRNLPD